jgi:hypothetical protein
VIDVVLLRVPVAIHQRSSEHQQELQREFQLIMFGAADRDIDVPKRLFDLIETINSRYQEATTEQTKILDDAVVRGDDVVAELRYHLPREVVTATIELSRMLDECDEYCRRGNTLLTLATPPEALAYRRWYLGEFVAQSKGESPLPWDEADIGALLATPLLRGE